MSTKVLNEITSNSIANAASIAEKYSYADLTAAAKLLKPKAKPVAEYVLAKREVAAMLTAELMSLSKTSKVVQDYLKNCDLSTYKSMCSPKAQEAIFNDRWPQLVKSTSLVIKCLTPSEQKNFVELGNKCTPTAYLKAVERGLSMSATKWVEVSKGFKK